MRIGRRRGRHSNARGQSLVELALVIPIALVILGGALDMGRLFFARVTIENSAREGAFFGSTNPRCDTSARAGCDDPGTADWHVRNEADALGGLSTAFSCIQAGTPVSVTACEAGDVYEASVTSTFDFLTPILVPLFGGSMQLQATAYSTVFNKAFDPSATPFPMPTAPPTTTPPPTGTTCTAPNLIGVKRHSGSAVWFGAGFTGAYTSTSPPNGNYTITSQVPTALSSAPCTSGVTVGGN